MKYIYTLGISLLVTIGNTNTASIASLKGSYTSLPEPLRNISILNGAIAIETGMLRRLYTDISQISTEDTTTRTEKNRKLLHTLFYNIPNTNTLQPTKQIRAQGTIQHTVENIISNLAILHLIDQVTKKTTQTNPHIITDAHNQLKAHIGKIGGQVSAEIVKNADAELTRLALLGALWYMKKYQPSLDTSYKRHLKTILKKTKKITNPLAQKLITIMQKEIEQISENTEAYQNSELQNMPTPWGITPSLDPATYEKIVIKRLHDIVGADVHPEVLEQINHITITTPDGISADFPDCVETLLRNLINILAYEQSTKTVSANQLLKNIPTARKELIEFYTKYPRFFSDEMGEINQNQKSESAYTDWAKLLSNRKGVFYNHATYEVHASLVNILLLTHDLLGQNWFEPPAEYPRDPELFLDTHIQKFVALFGTTKDSITTIQESGKITITSKDATYSFTVQAYPGHGDVTYQQPEIVEQVQGTSNYDLYPLLYSLTTITNWPSTPKTPWALFAQPSLDIPSNRPYILRRLKEIPYSWVTILHHLITTSPDQYTHAQALLALYTKIMKSAVWKDYIAEEKYQILLSAQKTLQETSLHSKRLTPGPTELFTELVKNNWGFEDACNAAISNLNDDSHFIRANALQIFIELVKKGQATADANSAMQNGLLDAKDIVREKANTLQTILRTIPK